MVFLTRILCKRKPEYSPFYKWQQIFRCTGHMIGRCRSENKLARSRVDLDWAKQTRAIRAGIVVSSIRCLFLFFLFLAVGTQNPRNARNGRDGSAVHLTFLQKFLPDFPREHARILLLVSFDLELYLGGGQLGLAPPQHPGSYAACLLVPATQQ